ARCHDHKFDPVTTEDYYALYGIFHSTRYPWPGIELEPKQRDFVALEAPDKIDRVLQQRKDGQSKLDKAVRELKKQRDAAKKDDDKKRLSDALKKAEAAAKAFEQQPLPWETLYAVSENGAIEDAAIQLKGNPEKTGEVVPRRFLKVLGGAELPPEDSTSGRLHLANWIADRNNPLTARVMVNRIWQYHFGRGLVPTANDFGRQGKPARHPELLDWLAARFMADGWSVKAMHRRIMTSHVYCMNSLCSESAAEKDPANELLSHFSRRRLDAEAIRDTLLQLSGVLDSSPGDAHPFPPQSEWKFTQHRPFKAVYESNHRSVYLMTQRIQRHPFLAIFDGADPSTSTATRSVTTTPLQALYLLNDPFVHEQSQLIAKQVENHSADDAERIRFCFELLYGRPATDEDVSAGHKFLKDAAGLLAKEQPGDSDSQSSATETVSATHSSALSAYVRALLKSNEFVYID
ncbi:MAG: DUF1553 domain-containing protein, partial [Planctomycetaceae bacterium]|nr:DUF1553 domain-containing protein [Planctomycetaceae bacterium]